jgi:hypothetical protein
VHGCKYPAVINLEKENSPSTFEGSVVGFSAAKWSDLGRLGEGSIRSVTKRFILMGVRALTTKKRNSIGQQREREEVGFHYWGLRSKLVLNCGSKWDHMGSLLFLLNLTGGGWRVLAIDALRRSFLSLL